MKIVYHTNLNMTEHCIFLPSCFTWFSSNICTQFLAFPTFCVCTSHFLCIFVVSFKFWFQYVIAHVNCLFVICILVHVHTGLCTSVLYSKNWLHRLAVYGNLTFSFLSFWLILVKKISKLWKKENVYMVVLLLNLWGIHLTQLFFMWNNDLVFHIVCAICNSLVCFCRPQTKQTLITIFYVCTL